MPENEIRINIPTGTEDTDRVTPGSGAADAGQAIRNGGGSVARWSSMRWDRRLSRQPSSVIVIRNPGTSRRSAEDLRGKASGAGGVAEQCAAGGNAPDEESLTSPLLLSRCPPRGLKFSQALCYQRACMVAVLVGSLRSFGTNVHPMQLAVVRWCFNYREEGSGRLEVTTHDWEADSCSGEEEKRLAWAQNISLAANITLLVVKAWAFAVSHSFAVLASMADSGVDLASQVVLYLCNRAMSKLDPRYPVGKTRLEVVGVLSCAVIMALSSFEVVQASAGTLWDYFTKGTVPHISLSVLLLVILALATGVKVVLYLICIALAKRSPTVAALAEDHRNDILSNSVAIATALAATWNRSVWWIDPVGAILISIYIVWSWAHIGWENIDLMVGKGAPKDYLEFLADLANLHNESLQLDELRAYHFGQRYLVEMEVLLPAAMTVQQSHDIALALQHKVEALEEVERCFVHVDWRSRDEPEHKVERNLQLGRSFNEPHASVKQQVPSFRSHSSARRDLDFGSESGSPVAEH